MTLLVAAAVKHLRLKSRCRCFVNTSAQLTSCHFVTDCVVIVHGKPQSNVVIRGFYTVNVWEIQAVHIQFCKCWALQELQEQCRQTGWITVMCALESVCACGSGVFVCVCVCLGFFFCRLTGWFCLIQFILTTCLQLPSTSISIPSTN